MYNGAMDASPELRTVTPLSAPPRCTVAVPGSKSISNRALVLAALADGVSSVAGLLRSQDTEVMLESLRRLGFQLEVSADGTVARIHGERGRIPAHGATLFVANSGTSIRFLTALCALGGGHFVLDGEPRMRERPQADLLDALRGLGVDASGENGCAPITIHGKGGLPGGETRLRAQASSQFLSALLMVAPYAHNDVTIRVEGGVRPHYVAMTEEMMAQWGAAGSPLAGPDAASSFNDRHGQHTREWEGARQGSSAAVWQLSAGQRYSAQPNYVVEPDASAASYFWAAAAVTGGSVLVPGLGRASTQGDVRFATEVLVEMGCAVAEEAGGLRVTGPPGKLLGVHRDMSGISDCALTLAAIAPFASSPTTVRNIAHARGQECDRIAAACAELSRLGVRVEEHPDGFTIHPEERLQPADIRTYGDHRVAMSFAITGLVSPGIRICDPGCVRKTFPGFWETLELLRRQS